MTTNGHEDIFITTSGVNGDDFEHCICQYILPILVPFGSSNQNSINVINKSSVIIKL